MKTGLKNLRFKVVGCWKRLVGEFRTPSSVRSKGGIWKPYASLCLIDKCGVWISGRLWRLYFFLRGPEGSLRTFTEDLRRARRQFTALGFAAQQASVQLTAMKEFIAAENLEAGDMIEVRADGKVGRVGGRHGNSH